MSVKIENLSARELNALIAQAKKRKTMLDKRKPVSVVRNRVNKLLKSEGYTLEELFGSRAGAGAASAPARAGKRTSKAAGRKLGRVEPKYADPANPEQTWTGRGLQPRWLSDYTSKGRALEEFLIKKSGA